MRRRSVSVALFALLLAAPALRAQTPSAARRPLALSDCARWRTIQGTTLSRDGVWLVYALAADEGDGELVARHLPTGREFRVPRGRDPQVTADNRFVAYALAPPFAEAEKARKEKRAADASPRPGFGLLDLATGRTVAIERVRRFAAPEESGRFVAYHRDPPAGKANAGAKGPAGSDLVVRDLGAGTEVTIPEVSDFAWSREGARLAVALDSADDSRDGVAVHEMGKDAARVAVRSAPGEYRRLAFDESGTRLAFLALAPRPREGEDLRTPTLWFWRAGDEKAQEIVSAATAGMPAGFAVAEAALEFSRDGRRLALGLRTAPRPRPKDAPEPIAVDLWHYKDPLLQSEQKVRADTERSRRFAAVWHEAGRRLVALGGPELADIRLTPDTRRLALGVDVRPYRALASWDREYADYFAVDVETGARRRLRTRHGASASLSPDERWFLFWEEDEGAWYVQDAAGKHPARNLTGALGVPFANEEWDKPTPAAPYGVAGWTAGDRHVYLYDRYDLWEIDPESGAARPVTGGRKGGLIFRYRPLDPQARTLPTDRTLLLATTDSASRAEGFWQLPPLAQKGRPARLVSADAAFGAPQKARDATTLVFTRERFEMFPDLWTAPDIEHLSAMTKATEANAQQDEFLWGRSELIEFASAEGRPLRAILTVPQDFDPSKKYPLLVYLYERLSEGLHRYVRPAPGTSVNVSRYVSNGYCVLRPDIAYTVGYPGESALQCVVPAVQKALARGFIDPARIGLQGHSWGGYQATYLVTRTPLFRAVAAGAAVSDMISAYGGLRYQSGRSRAFQYEREQSRIGGPPWVRPLQYIENSPIFWVDRVRTPYLALHNDNDGAVPWTQSLEFFTALRRLGREAYLFNYNGEGHGLTNRENQKHWSARLAEFFDHYLLGAPRPPWMESGIPFLERGTIPP